MEKIDGKSLDIREDSIDKLKQLFPEIITEGEQIDFEKLKAILTDKLDESNEKYTFTWNGKSEAMRIANTPTSGTLKPVLEKSKEGESTENLYIEGDNLEVLKLLQKSYSHKVDVIYIDPPYNTGKDFVYKDNYKDSLENYFELTGQVDKEGYKLTTNVESNGRFHSDWLNMIYPRLKLARNLLANDGVIFISIDDNELSNLSKVCEEIFGEKNFIGQISRQAIKGGSKSRNIREVHDYILIFAKNIEEVNFGGYEVEGIKLDLEDDKGKYAKGRELNKWGAGSRREDSPSMYYPIPGPNGEDVYPIRNDGSDGRWRLGKEKMFQLLSKGDAIFEPRGDGTYIVYEKLRDDSPRIKQFTTWFEDKYINAKGTEELKKLFETERSLFDYAKPTQLIIDLLIMANKKEALVIDFFAGSASTADAVMQLNSQDKGNRKYIMVQLPEILEESSEAYKKGYRTISDVAVDRIKLAGDKINSEYAMLEKELDMGFKYFALDNSNIKKWNIDEDNIEDELLLFTDNFEEGSTHDDIVYELLLKQGIELTVPIEKESFEGTSIYIVANGAMFVVIGNNIDESIGEYIRDYESMFNQDEDSEIVVAFQDIGFEDDSAKLNTFEILKAAGFKDENIFTI